MFKIRKKIRHTEENFRLYEFTIKAYCDLARNAKTEDGTDRKMKEHLFKIIDQVGIPNYENFEYIEEVEAESDEPEQISLEPDFIKIHDKKRNSIRNVRRLSFED